MSPRYGFAAIVLHWAVGFALLGQLALGFWMVGLPEAPPGLQARWFNLHKSIGLTIGAFVLLRLWWRLRHAPPALELPRWQAALAAANHRLLYACMIALPVSGYLGSSFSGYPVKLFGHALPAWSGAWPAGKAFFGSLHVAAAWLLVALVALHVAGALKNLKILRRMVPWSFAP